jgi:hypothetical protein
MLLACACNPKAQPPAAVEAEPEPVASEVTSGPRLHPSVIESIALLEDTARRCETVGLEALQRLRNEGASYHPNDSFAYYLEHDATSQLETAREAQRVIAGLVGEVRHNAALEVGRSIHDMSMLCDRLCAHVGTARFEREEYQRGFDEYLGDFENAYNRLRREIAVSPQELAGALLKHAPAIERAVAEKRLQRGELAAEPTPRRLSPEEYARQQAEWQAHSEQLENQRSTHEAAINDWRSERSSQPAPLQEKVGLRAPPPPPSRDTMRPWHAAWGAKAPAAKAALSRYLTLAPARDPGLKGVCTELSTAGQAALVDPAVLGSPDRALNLQVLAFFNAVKGLGDACRAGLPIEAVYQQKHAEHALSQVEGTVRRYSLEP